MTPTLRVLLLALVLALSGTTAAAPADAPPVFDRARRADGARIVPDRFLRGYDPLTILFPADAGPKAGGPEDSPEKFATMIPKVAGAWRWLDARALQFRPAEPWTPLERVAIRLGAAETKLVALLPTPTTTVPAAGAEPAGEISQIALTFPQPVDLAALRRLLSIELRPAPGLSPDGAQTLPAAAYEIVARERGARNDAQEYLVRFHERIADGRVAVLRLKLADEAALDAENFELRVQTATPFAVVAARCGHGWNDAPSGDILLCASNGEPPPAAPTASENDNGAVVAYAPRNRRRLILTFSAEPETPDILRAREALRITPPVDDLAVETSGREMKISGAFLADRLYEISISPGALRDGRGRPLAATFVRRFAYSLDRPALQWDAASGVVERLGPQLLPLRGRGYDRADIRIHAIDPLSRDFWPFPAEGLETNDESAPPLPGNEPAPWRETENIDAEAMKARLKFLGSPAVSRLVDLPIRRSGGDARFGLDLSTDFARIAGAAQPGAYLVGLRAVDDSVRHWLRIQATDLSLSVIEEPARVRFAVTSLATAQPVAGAQLRVEGVRDNKFLTLFSGVTDTNGFLSWSPTKQEAGAVRRVIAIKGNDTLVVDPDHAPAEYAHELWSKPEAPWLSWTGEDIAPRADTARTLCHLFSERPIYRPEESAHIRGFVRDYHDGGLSFPATGGALVVTGPGAQEWRFPIKPDANGGFYQKFDARASATGDYTVKYEPDPAKKPSAKDATDNPATVADVSCGQFSFRKEAYRLPTFEVVLNAPQTVALDTTFNVDLLARYFAGGLAADRPVKWRVAQFPHVFTPPRREGFQFSTDSRFSGDSKFRSTAVLEREQRTDAGGAARMTFDTTIEPTAQPRRYSIEATVTGEDGIDVRNVQNVIALPPFALGLKIPRYVEKPGIVAAEAIAVDGDGAARAGLEMTLRLIRRNWVSTLQASDFAQGAAKYVTRTQDETLLERRIISGADASKIDLPVQEAGVYIVEIEAWDRLKRRQQVAVDFFVGGDTPVTFARPPAQTATISSDRDKYAPGETATLIIQSPFQNARALAIIEQPDGLFDYVFVDIANGFGRFALNIKKEQTPKLAVHFLIMRGRLKDSAPQPAATFDQGKPVTIAATKWIEVTPVKNTLNVKIEHPAKARPGQEIEVTLRLADDVGKPVAGEATFWLVDQAVLSLAKERPLDPLPDFIVARDTKMSARDTRNTAFGLIPLEEIAGGDGGELQEWGAETNISVRRNFTPVPIYLPNVRIGPDGVAKIKVTLPDTLTVFKLRAKATSGPDRFGAAGGEMSIRQEIVAQPAIPRFLRSGDSFDIGLIARIVEGPGGAGRAAISAPALTLAGETQQRIEWTQNRPARMTARAQASPDLKDAVTLDFSVTRDADRAKDVAQIDLPVRPDREPQHRFEIVELAPGETRTLAEIADPIRPRSFFRRATVATDPALVKLVAGMNALVAYPYGCTEQRLALARAGLAMKAFTPVLAASGLETRIADIVRSAQQSIEQSIDGDGLVAFWPRARGSVSLTAWSYAFLVQAGRAGEAVDGALMARLAEILRAALRSDYPRLLDGEQMRERVEALTALAEGGKLDDAYLAEFVRRADFVPNGALAGMTAAAAKTPAIDRRVVDSLLDSMWGRVKFARRNGQEVYAGLAGESAEAFILPSETRDLALMMRASVRAAPADPRGAALRAALLRLGEGDGWGATNADAAAIEALAEAWRKPDAPRVATFVVGDRTTEATIDAGHPVTRFDSAENAPLAITNRSNAPLIALIETQYTPKDSGATAPPETNGFVIAREMWRIRADAAPEKLEPVDGVIRVGVSDVVEERIELVNPEDRTHVAVAVPLAAGFEPLNPSLANAPAEARPGFAPTLAPTWQSFGDDKVFYAYDALPKGNYRFAFRLKALTAGAYAQPPATAEAMYRKGVRGASAGARIAIGE